MRTALFELQVALGDRHFMCLSRRFEETNIRGYVLATGPRFFLLAVVSDRIWFDGFECFRYADITGIEVDPYASFAEEALRRRGQTIRAAPRIDLTNIESLLESVNRAFPLITIHREVIDSEVCHIGCIAKIAKGKLSLLEITPDAEWETEPTEYRVSEITRVSFGGDYEDALHIVGGSPPKRDV